MKYRYLALLACLLAPSTASAQVVPRPERTPPTPRPTPFRMDTARMKLEFDLPRFRGKIDDLYLDSHLKGLRVESAPFHMDLAGPAFPLRGHVMNPPHPPARYQDDPADSLFRAAHSLFSKQEYRAGATRFAEVRTRHPNTKYFCDAAYYEAYARYRLGTPAELRTAYTVLDGVGTRCATASRRADLPELRARIDGALARAGDGPAAERVRRDASQGENVCDSEERHVKIGALGALAQVDPQAADPVLRTVLNTKDDCSAPVRRQKSRRHCEPHLETARSTRAP